MIPFPPQSNRDVAELIAKFRTPAGFSWEDLADDIETALNGRVNAAAEIADDPWTRKVDRIRALIQGIL